MGSMDENASARESERQATEARRLWELSYGHQCEDWPDPLREPYEPAQADLDLLHSQVPGHRWDGWRRLTGDENYFAACSCGWRSTETRFVSPMLRQVRDHLDAVRALRGWGPAPRRRRRHATSKSATAASAGRSKSMRGSYTRRWPTSKGACPRRSRRRLTCCPPARTRPTVSWPSSARRGPRRAGMGKDPASAQRAEALQRQAERAEQVRNQIVATAGALAAIAEEVALLNRDRETRPGGTPDSST